MIFNKMLLKNLQSSMQACDSNELNLLFFEKRYLTVYRFSMLWRHNDVLVILKVPADLKFNRNFMKNHGLKYIELFKFSHFFNISTLKIVLFYILITKLFCWKHDMNKYVFNLFQWHLIVFYTLLISGVLRNS